MTSAGRLSGRMLAASICLTALWFCAEASAQTGTPSNPTTPKAGAPSPMALPPGEGGDPVPPRTYYEQGILTRSGEVIEALGPDLMGDAINIFSGDVVFTQTDVTVPGNNVLPVMVGRRRGLATPQTFGGGLFGD